MTAETGDVGIGPKESVKPKVVPPQQPPSKRKRTGDKKRTVEQKAPSEHSSGMRAPIVTTDLINELARSCQVPGHDVSSIQQQREDAELALARQLLEQQAANHLFARESNASLLSTIVGNAQPVSDEAAQMAMLLRYNQQGMLPREPDPIVSANHAYQGNPGWSSNGGGDGGLGQVLGNIQIALNNLGGTFSGVAQPPPTANDVLDLQARMALFGAHDVPPQNQAHNPQWNLY